MKFADVQKLREAGLINNEQEKRIVDHFKLPKGRSRFLIVLVASICLFGTVARTGLMFVVSGVFLIVFGVYLEKKRRKFMQQIQTAKAGKENLP